MKIWIRAIRVSADPSGSWTGRQTNLRIYKIGPSWCKLIANLYFSNKLTEITIGNVKIYSLMSLGTQWVNVINNGSL